MYAFIEGAFKDISPNRVVIQTGGVGYELQITLNTFSKIEHQKEGSLYTYLHVREDILALHGFATIEEKQTFLSLLKVNGIGISACNIILSTLSPSEVKHSIVRSDIQTLTKIKGIGKKTAERVILELKDKIVKDTTEPSSLDIEKDDDNRSSIKNDAIMAVVHLGISKPQAEKAVDKAHGLIDNKENISQLIKEALKYV